MTAIELIKGALEGSRQWLLALVSDMKDAPTTSPTPGNGNHPLWVLGHITYAEASLLSDFILGEPNPRSDWQPLFGQGSKPVADAGRYPSINDLLAELTKVRALTLKVLSAYKDADLDKPSKAPEELKPFFGTIGQCFSMMSLHITFHAGQVADARKVLGRPPIFG